MRISTGVAWLLMALAVSTLGGAAAPPDGPPAAQPVEPALVDLTTDSMIFGPDQTQKNAYGKYVNGTIWSAAFAPDGKTLVTGDHLGMVNVFDPANGRHLIRFRASDPDAGRLDARAVAPDGQTIAVHFKERGGVATMDPTSGLTVREMQTVPNPQHPAAKGLAFSPDGKLLAGGMDGTGETLLWDAASGRLLRVIAPQMLPGNRVPAFVRGVAFSPDGATLYISGHRLRAWDVRGERPRPTEWPDDAYVGDLRISRDGSRLAVIGAFGGHTRGFHELGVVDAATGRVLCSVEEDGYQIMEAAFTPDGRTIATIVWYNEGKHPEDYRFILRLRDAGTLRPVATAWFGRGVWFPSLAISPDGGTIAIGGSAGVHTAIGIARWDGTRISPWRKDP